MNPDNIKCVVAFEIRTTRSIGHAGGSNHCLTKHEWCSAVWVAGNPGPYIRSYEVSEAIHAH